MPMRVTMPVLAFLATLHGAVALSSNVNGADTASETRREMWVTQASTGLDVRTIEALQRIAGANRRLLALRAYLRAGAALTERWSWSQQQITAYPSTAEGHAAALDIEAVASAFAAENPGFTLRVNRQPRSLELQLAHWNENVSVGAAAAALAASLEQKFPDTTTTVDTAALRSALSEWKPSVAVPLAAPGLSPHGQARAFDFQIEHEGRIVAGLDFASARQQWDAAGWTQKLRTAVRAAGGLFVGPLASPYEPWHYAYTGMQPKPPRIH
jgi:hypothetical protein